LLNGKAAAPALFHLISQLLHGCLRDDTPFAACDRSLRAVNGF
jgi:hypothetical protein